MSSGGLPSLEDFTRQMEMVANHTESEADKKLGVRFYWRPIENKRMSVEGYHLVDGKPQPCDCTNEKEKNKRAKAHHLVIDDDGEARRLKCDCKTEEEKVHKVEEGIHLEQEHYFGGRPIYEDTLMINIRIPGDSTNIIDRPAWISQNPNDSQAHNIRFPRHYEAFMARKTQVVIGTPLEELTKGTAPVLKMAQVKEYEHFGVQTVEQLVAMSDVNGQKFPLHNTVKRGAQRYLDSAREAAPMAAMKAELQKKDERMTYLEGLVKQMGDKVAAMQSSEAPKRGPGRPPKKALEAAEATP